MPNVKKLREGTVTLFPAPSSSSSSSLMGLQVARGDDGLQFTAVSMTQDEAIDLISAILDFWGLEKGAYP